MPWKGPKVSALLLLGWLSSASSSSVHLIFRGLDPYNDSDLLLEKSQNDVKAYEAEAGTSFSILCLSNAFETAWNSTAEAFRHESVVGSILESPCDFANSSFTFCTSVNVKNASGYDAGYYSCGPGEYIEDQEEVAASPETKVYVYVKDPAHLLATKNYFNYLTVHERKDFVLPCIPSHPGVTVRLYRQEKSRPDVPYHQLRRGVVYDPRLGVVVRNASANDSARYKCEFVLGNTTKLSLTNVFVAPADDSYTIPQQPEIELIVANQSKKILNDGEVAAGSSFQLLCKVILDVSHTAMITWFKDGKKVNPGRRAETGTFPSGLRYISSKLHVNTTEDSGSFGGGGNYVCMVKNHVGQPNNVSVQIVVNRTVVPCRLSHPPHNKSVSFSTEDNCLKMRAKADQEAQANFSFEMPLGSSSAVVWTTPLGKAYSSDDDTSFMFASSSDRRRFSLQFGNNRSNEIIVKMSNVSVEDNGKYAFSCLPDESEKEMMATVEDKQIFYCLNVLDIPRAGLFVPGHRHALFLVGHSYGLRCAITANPDPEKVVWSVCNQSGDTCTQNTFWMTKNTSQLSPVPGGRDFEFVSEFEVSVGPSESVQVVQCKACQGEEAECGESPRLEMLPTDFFPPERLAFGICVKRKNHCHRIQNLAHRDVIERFQSESVDIVCAVSKYAVPKEETAENLLRMTSDRHSSSDFVLSYTSYSVQKFLSIGALNSLEDDGASVRCINRTLKIKVKGIFKPTPARGFNMDGSNTFSDAGEETTIVRLDCSMEGTPEPDIRWLKDGKSLDQEMLLRRNRTLVLAKSGMQLEIRLVSQEDEGVYSCIATNLAGTVESTHNVYSSSSLWPKTPLKQTLYASVIITACSSIVLSVIVAYCFRRNKLAKDELNSADIALFLHGDPASINPAQPLEDQAYLLPYDDQIEFPRDRLELGQQIGSGAFGRVVKGLAIGINEFEARTVVAVKMPKPPTSKAQLVAMMSEIKIMLHLGKHLNVVNLLGCCTIDLAKKELLVIVEYCCHGNLQQFLLSRRHSFINQVHPATGIYDPTVSRKISANRSSQYHIGAKRHRVSYAKLDMNRTLREMDDDELEPSNSTRQESSEQESPHPLQDKKISAMSTDSAFESHIVGTDMTMVSHTYATRAFKRSKIHKISNDSGFVAAAANNGPRESPGQPGPSRNNNKVSVISTDSDFDHVINSTDMTLVSLNRDIYQDKYEQQERTDVIFTKDLLSWSYQVSKGMEHLSAKKVVHGDLAARNILLAENNVVKICDFGLAKNVYSNPNYQKTTNGPLPIKWMAPESLTYRIFSSQSDVWSFGIVLWEIFSLARTPYPGLDPDESFQKKLEQGYRMESPPFAPSEMYKVMRDCWMAEPGVRPTFTELSEKIGEELQEGEQEHYLNLNKPYEEENEVRERHYRYTVLATGSKTNTPTLPVDKEKRRTSILDPSVAGDDLELTPMLTPTKNGLVENPPVVANSTLPRAFPTQPCAPASSGDQERNLFAKSKRSSSIPFFNAAYSSNYLQTEDGRKRTKHRSGEASLPQQLPQLPTLAQMGKKRQSHLTTSKTCNFARPASGVETEPGAEVDLSKSMENGREGEDEAGGEDSLQASRQDQASCTSVSSGFHSTSSDVLKMHNQCVHQQSPPNAETDPLRSQRGHRLARQQGVEEVWLTPPPSYESAVIHEETNVSS